MILTDILTRRAAQNGVFFTEGSEENEGFGAGDLCALTNANGIELPSQGQNGMFFTEGSEENEGFGAGDFYDLTNANGIEHSSQGQRPWSPSPTPCSP